MVMKFGGTSLGNAEMIKKAASLIEQNDSCFVVCSAVGGVTDMLADIAIAFENDDREKARLICLQTREHFEKICSGLFDPGVVETALRIVQDRIDAVYDCLKKEFTSIDKNFIIAQGEFITSEILAFFLNSQQVPVKLLNAFDFLYAGADGEPVISDVRSRLFGMTGFPLSGRYLTQGFICLDHNGNPSNLGRGGSDYTATIAGAALSAQKIEIWTDIDGIRNNDPGIVYRTYPIRKLSFQEASELAYFGAKILHPASVWPAKKYNIPVHIKKTSSPRAPGTLLCRESVDGGVKGVSAKRGVTAIRVASGRMLNTYGFLSRIFAIFEKCKTPVDVVTTSEVSVSVTIDNEKWLETIKSKLESLGEVKIERNLAIVCVVGDILEKHKGYAVKILDSLRSFSVKMVSFGGSRNNITIVVPEKEVEEILCSLNRLLFKIRHL